MVRSERLLRPNSVGQLVLSVILTIFIESVNDYSLILIRNLNTVAVKRAIQLETETAKAAKLRHGSWLDLVCIMTCMRRFENI